MATHTQRYRGTTAQHANYIGPEGEITVDTTKKTIVVQDGITAGGYPLAHDAAVVHKQGDESVEGTKTFTNPIVGSLQGNADTATRATTAAKADTATTADIATTATAADSATTAASADKLSASKTIAISGGATGTATGFDGSANITIPVTALDVSTATAGVLPIARGGTGSGTKNFVDLSTAQTVAGSKTFSSSPVVPTVDAQDVSTKAASTGQVDGALYTMVKAVDTIPSDATALAELKAGLRDGALVVATEELQYPELPTMLRSPNAFSRYEKPSVTKTSVTIPGGMNVRIGDVVYGLVNDVTLSTSSLSDRAGKDFYIYAVQPTSGFVPEFVLSANSTVPDGYTADTSRKIGGFHCLCADVGTITDHPLSDYVAGDILPASIWDLWHRAKSSNEGMVYDEDTDRWVDIYLASYDTQLRSMYGGTCADGASTVKFHGEKFNEEFRKIKKYCIYRDEFVSAAWGSNLRTNIAGSADAGTTGGHSDSAGRRMISNIGLEDACGFMWQWCESTGAGGSGWGISTYNAAVDPESYGSTYGTLYRLIVGGDWADSSYCGPRCVSLNHASAVVSAGRGGRGASEPRSRLD